MEVGPGTLGTWVNTIGGEKVVPLINLMHETLLAVVFIHIDETPLQVLRSDKAVGADHYIVARAGGPPGPPAGGDGASSCTTTLHRVPPPL